jgi:hypothetical protein
MIGLIECNAKSRNLKRLTCKGTLREMFICLRPPTLLYFCLGWSRNFVGSETGQTQSVKLLQNMVTNITPFPPSFYILYMYKQYSYSHKEVKGGGES